MTAAVVVLGILLFGCGCLLWWQQLELNSARRDARLTELKREIDREHGYVQ